LFGVGGSPRFIYSSWALITLEDPYIYEEGIKTLVFALQSYLTDSVHLGLAGERQILTTLSKISMSNDDEHAAAGKHGLSIGTASFSF